MPRIGGTGNAFALTHEGWAQIRIVLAVSAKAFESLAAVELGVGAGKSFTAEAAGTAGIVCARGVFFVSTACGINVLLKAAHLFGGSFRHPIFVFLFGKAGVKLLLEVVVQASLSGALVLFYLATVFIIHRTYTLA